MNESRPADPWVIRTDFSSDSLWEEVQALVATPLTFGGRSYCATVWYVSDMKDRGKAAAEVVRSLPEDYPYRFCLVVDRDCINDVEHSLLVVGFYPSDESSWERAPAETPLEEIVTFRVVPAAVVSVTDNLSIANMDFEDFLNTVDDDGVFRGPH